MQKINLYKSLGTSIIATLILSACNSGTNSSVSNGTEGTLKSSVQTANSALSANSTLVLANNKTSVDLTYTNNSKFSFHCAAYKDTSTKISSGSSSFTQDIGPSIVDYLAFSTNFSTDSYGTLSCNNTIDSSNPWGFKISSPSPQVNTVTLDSNTLAANSTKVSCIDPKTGVRINQSLSSAHPSIDCRAGTYVYNDNRANSTDGIAVTFSSTMTPTTPVLEIVSKPPVLANEQTNISLGVANNVGNGEIFTCSANSIQRTVNGGSSTQSWKLTSSGSYPGTLYYQSFNPTIYGTLSCANNSDSLNKWGLKISTNKSQTVEISLNKNTVANYSTNVMCLSGDGSKISQTLTPENNSITCRAQNWRYTTSVDSVGDVRADMVAVTLVPLKEAQPNTPVVTPTPVPTPIAPKIPASAEFSMPNPIPAGVVTNSLSDIYANALVGFDNNTGDNLKCTTPTKSKSINGIWSDIPGLNLVIGADPVYTQYSSSNQSDMTCSNASSSNPWGVTLESNGGRSNLVSLSADSKANYTTSVSCVSSATNATVTQVLKPGIAVSCRAAKYMYSDGVERSDPIAIVINK